MKTVQYRVYPSPAQKRAINEQLECHRLLYNTALDDAEACYKTGAKISDFDLVKKWVNHFRKTDERFKRCNYSSLQHTVRRFGKARNAVIKRRMAKGVCALRHKQPGRFNSMEYSLGDGTRVKKDRFYAQGIGLLKTFWHTDVPDYNSAILTRRGERYYVSLAVKTENGVKPAMGGQVGIDFGIQTFLTLSDGEKIESPRFARQGLTAIKKAHRKIHAAEKGSAKRHRCVKVLQKISRRIADRRKNFNHQLTRRLVNLYSLIAVEDLNPTELDNSQHPVAKRNTNRKIHDLGFGQFKNFLAYKAENAGKRVVFVNPAYTTQECSQCGKRTVKTLDERQHQCSCGLSLDRDINAARNILASGLRCLAQA